MTEQETKRINSEFSNGFDVLYNNIVSNQSPGLDEYEKSVFLTKAQDDIIKSYFSPKTNKTFEGFDGSEKRQIDFSMIMRSKIYTPREVTIKTYVNSEGTPVSPPNKPFIKDLDRSEIPVPLIDYDLIDLFWKEDNIYYTNAPLSRFVSYIDKSKCSSVELTSPSDFLNGRLVVSVGFLESFFDMRDNTKSIILDDKILMITNEYVEVDREGEPARLTVLPISYTEYSRLMSKPFKRPIKSQAWRLLDNSSGSKKVEIIIGPNDHISSYAIRYVKRPRAIRLTTFDDGLFLDGGKEEQCCELDPILFPEIIQRAVEFAKAVYVGDLSSQIALGQASQTDVGIVTQGR